MRRYKFEDLITPLDLPTLIEQKRKQVEATGRARCSGVFRYYDAESFASPRFTVEDDDGIGFVLDFLRYFEGKEVVITVEEKR